MKETFEKETAEYVIKKHNINIDITKQPIDFSLRCVFAEDFTDFQNGAKFGYKKGEKAIELLKKLLEEEKDNMYWKMNGSDKSSYYEVRKQAEQFLKGE